MRRPLELLNSGDTEIEIRNKSKALPDSARNLANVGDVPAQRLPAVCKRQEQLNLTAWGCVAVPSCGVTGSSRFGLRLFAPLSNACYSVAQLILTPLCQ